MISVSSISSPAVIILELDWLPQMCYNSIVAPTSYWYSATEGRVVLMETLHSIVIAIMGNVAAYYIVKWLDWLITLIRGN